MDSLRGPQPPAWGAAPGTALSSTLWRALLQGEGSGMFAGHIAEQ